MANDIVTITTEAQVQNAISLMLDGETKKAACEAANLSTKTFDRHLASNPGIVLDVQATVRAKFADFLDRMNDERKKDLESLIIFADRLRGIIEDKNSDIDDAIKASAALLKLEKQFSETMEGILPVIKKTEAPPARSPMEDDLAQQLMAQITTGAKLYKVTTTKMIEVADQAQIIEGVSKTIETETQP